MKEIKAIIKPNMLQQVLYALHEIEGLPGCIVSQVQTYGRSSAKGEASEGLEPVQGAKLEIVVSESMVPKVMNAIQKNAHTGNKGDGKIFVIECKDAVRIRTGERGREAI